MIYKDLKDSDPVEYEYMHITGYDIYRVYRKIMNRMKCDDVSRDEILTLGALNPGIEKMQQLVQNGLSPDSEATS